jgi:predicted GTPase
MSRRRVLILGAAGRDFHDFNVVYRDDPAFEVVAFTAAQIPGIEGRRYPPELAGPLYPQGIPILDEAALDSLLAQLRVDKVVFAYSDVPHLEVMHLASRALAAGADFELLGPASTTIRAPVPVVAVSAVRTGAGKSPAARWISRRLRARGLRVAVVRHPMPYGDLAEQAVQRFASRADLERAGCTLEEREEYEPHLDAGSTVHAGVDYARVIAEAAAGADVLLWDGGNNDFPFVRPDFHIVLADALRPADGAAYHPGETCLRMADVVVVSKADAAPPGAVETAIALARRANARARIVRANLPVRLDDPAAVKGKRALVVEDGPTITHGGMPHGAGTVAARAAGAGAIVDPRPWAPPPLREVYRRYPHIGAVLPASGYSGGQLAALKEAIDAADAEVVVSATPVDLAALLRPAKPVVRARYEYADADSPGLGGELDAFLTSRGL